MIGKQLPAHISPFRLSISNDADEIAEIQEAIKTDRRILEHDVPDRVHEIRRMLDPSYNKVNATAEVALSEDDDDDLDGQDQIELDNESHSEEVVSDSDSEGVKEFIERSKVSKKKVQKQLAKGDNKPTTKEAASKKRKRVEDVREKRATDTLENRKKIKLEEAHAKAQADKEMKMHVMPTKAKKLYGAMQHGIKQRKEQLDQLEDRREKVCTTYSNSSCFLRFHIPEPHQKFYTFFSITNRDTQISYLHKKNTLEIAQLWQLHYFNILSKNILFF